MMSKVDIQIAWSEVVKKKGEVKVRIVVINRKTRRMLRKVLLMVVVAEVTSKQKEMRMVLCTNKYKYSIIIRRYHVIFY